MVLQAVKLPKTTVKDCCLYQILGSGVQNMRGVPGNVLVSLMPELSYRSWQESKSFTKTS